MQYRRLGKNGPKVSAIGLGTGQFGAPGWGYGSVYGDAQITNVIRTALDMGISLIDTSETYGNGKSETILGSILTEYRRDDYAVITKVAPWNLSFHRVLKAVDSSLKRLQLDYVDLYLVHYPNPFVRMRETFRALERLVEEGKVRYIGVSNFNPMLLERAQGCMSKNELVVDEIEYNALSRKSEKNTIPYCARNGIGVVAYSPLAGGLLTGRYSADVRPRDRARAFNFLNRRGYFLKAEPLFQCLRNIAVSRQVSMAQVALAYLLRLDCVVAIPAALSEAEVRENANSSSIRLTRDEILDIDELSVSVGMLTWIFDHFAIRPISWTKASIEQLSGTFR
ncbi:MAG: aldo/keto reductase [Nitrososphaerales archaeon]|jgi:aryl-alcohol dehydrogenase-like predicted oxidoreductase